MRIIPLLSRLKELNITIRLIDGQLKINAPKGKLTPGLLEQLKTKKQEIVQFLHNTQKSTEYSPIKPMEKKEYYSLSSAQKRLYFIQQIVPENTAYNLPITIPLDSHIRVEKLESVFRQLICRHESLRTSFSLLEGEPVQRIHKDVKFEIEYFDLYRTEVKAKVEKERSLILEGTGGLAPMSEESAASIIKKFIRPFDLSRAPLLRIGLIELPHTPSTLRGHPSQEGKENKCLLLVDIHHIITDGTSQDILSSEFMTLSAGDTPEILRLQYKDYSEWQNSKKQETAIKKQKEYWLKTFAEELPILDLPTDYPRPLIQDFTGSQVLFHLEENQTKRIKAMTEESNSTLFMVLLAIFNVFLSKLSSQEDIIIGTPIAARRHVHLKTIIGMFVNTLALRNYPSGEKSFTDFLQEIKHNTIAAYENQEYPFEDLVDQLAVNRDTSRNPVFNVVFNLVNNTRSTSEREIPQTREIDRDYIHRPGTAKFDLQLSVTEDHNSLIFSFDYCKKLFKPKTIERFIRYFQKIAAAAVQHPQRRIWEIEILSDDEKHQLLKEFNQTAAIYPKDKTIHRIFAEQAEQTPDKIAVIGPLQIKYRSHMTYRTYKNLNEQSDRLAFLLKEKGVYADTIVALLLERSIEMIIGILGILKAGGAYLPLDPDYPEERKQYMLTDSNAKILLTNREITNSFGIWNLEFGISPRQGGQLAYIIYTSGTTGKPKGVMVSHENVVRLMVNDCSRFDFEDRDVWTLFHSYCFDFSVWEIWGALLYGGKLVIVPGTFTRDPQQFLELLIKQKVTVLNQTPGAFYHLIDEALTTDHRRLYLRYVIFGGEALSPARLKPWQENNPQTQLINMYGITETTVHVTYKKITPKEIHSNQSNIGTPIPTLCTYIMDKYMKLQPVGVSGQLYVAGKGVTRGYLNRPGLTNQKFLRGGPGGAVFSKSAPPGRRRQKLYRTGDLARWLSNGDMEYLGRIDHQVKIRGYRVELGEIENQLLEHPKIKEAVVLFHKNEKNITDNYLCAYIVPLSPGSLTSAQLKGHLSRQLPGYMIPAYFIQLEKLPLTPNGKLDKAALPGPQPETGVEYIAPGDEVEEKLVEICREVLGLENTLISTHRNFFDLGGHSLNAIRLVNSIHKTLKIKLSIQDIFQFPTIAELAAIIKKNKITPFIEITPLPPQEYYELSYAQKRLWFLQKRNPDSQAFNMPERVTLNEKVEEAVVRQVLKKLIDRHESLRTYFTEAAGKVVQKIVPGTNIDVPLELVNSSGLPPEQQQAQRLKLLVEESRVPFHLEIPPLLRVKLIKYSENEYDLVFNMHHLISDGWSMEVLRKEFSLLYNASKPGDDEDVEPEPVKIQYKDYAYWHNRLLENPERMAGPLAFWKNHLQGTLSLLNLPYDFPPNELTAKKSSGYRAVVNESITQKLRTLAKQYNASLFMVLLAGINILLSRLRGQEDILIGLPGAARQHEDLKNTIGLFVNTLMLRTRLDKQETFTDFLKRIQADTLKILEYQDYPLELICEQLEIKYPRISFFFNMVNTGPNLEVLEDSTPFHIQTTQDAKFHIALYLGEHKNGINIVCNYYTQLFMPVTIEKIIQMYIRLLEHIAEAPGKQINEYRSTQKRKLKR